MNLPQRYKGVRLDRIGVSVHMSRHLAGQKVTRAIAGGVISPDSYPRKHIFIGEWRLGFPGGDPDVTLSGVNVWPTGVVKCPNGFVWEALGDAMYYCAVGREPLEAEALVLDTGDVLVVSARNLLFVPPGSSWRLNGELKIGQQMLACENSSAKVQAVSPMRVFRIAVR